MRILFVGDIMGGSGRNAVKFRLAKIKEDNRIDLTIANVENAAGGFGVTSNILNELYSYGIDVATSGNHIWDKKEIINVMDKEQRLLRPANYPDGVPGTGSGVYTLKDSSKAAVLNLEGRVYMHNIECPFKTALKEIVKLKEQTNIIIIDFHAEVTSEKNALGWYLDGKVTAVLGTHTHVQTADEKILPEGTAYITDAGMTGSIDSVIGIKKEIALKKFLLQMPQKFEIAEENICVCGVIIEADPKTGKASSIERVKVKV